MKKFLLIMFIILTFLIGISIGNNSSAYNKLFEKSLDEFEEEIVKPNNTYDSKDLKPNEGLINKIANKIDNIIESISDKIS